MLFDPPSPRDRHGGFVLIAMLLVVAVIAAVIATLGMRIRVETRLGAAREAEEQSRRTALAAMDLALAHLQRLAGPDQRFTARADLVSESPVRQPSWTGVWDNAAGPAVVRSWLVSGNHDLNPLAVTPEMALDPSVPPADNEVLLVDRGTVSRLDQRVKVATVPITIPQALLAGPGDDREATVGHFAYWVGDEGIKTSVAGANGVTPLDYDNSMPLGDAGFEIAAGSDWQGDADAGLRLRQMRLSGARSDLLFPGFDPAAQAAGLARVVRRLQLPLVSPMITRAQARGLFHSVTDCSRAVVVDHTAPRARLRRDLSDTPDVQDVALRRMLVNRPRDASEPSEPHHTVSGACDPTLSEYGVGFSVGPVLTECGLRLHFFRNASDASLWMIREVQVELWNPNTSPLSAETESLELAIHGWPEIDVSYGEHRLKIDLASHLGRFTMDRNTHWGPGEILVLKGHDVLDASGVRAAVQISATGTLPHDPEADRLTVSWPARTAAESLQYVLAVGGAPVARYEPEVPYEAVELAVMPAEVQEAVTLGFGFALKNDLSYWMDGAREDARDPRSYVVRGGMIETSPSATSWSARPGENRAEIALDDDTVFNVGRTYCCVELPRQEIVSVGQFQHLVSPRPNAVGNPWGGPANALFDRYFLSTIPRWAAFNPSDPLPLPNPFIELRAPSAAPIPLGERAAASDGSSRFLLDRDHAASFLLIRGAFNVNSTSVQAWQAVLAGASIPGWRYGRGAHASLTNAHFRFAHTAQQFAADPYALPSAADAYSRGVRTLTPNQVEAMSESLVRSLRRRGVPFTSLAGFIAAGVLEQAIADAGINEDLPPSWARSPAWLTQADVLSAIAPFIVPRSDTFLLRCYGDVRNPVTGEIEARSWCEATVQRVPSLTPPARGAVIAAGDVVEPDPEKYPFGRKFIVTGFRWLGPADI